MYGRAVCNVMYVCSGRKLRPGGVTLAQRVRYAGARGNTIQVDGTEGEREGRWMCEWMDGWFRVGLCSACEGKCSTVKEDEGMEWMGWDGMVRQGEREWYGYGKVRQGEEGMVGGGWSGLSLSWAALVRKR